MQTGPKPKPDAEKRRHHIACRLIDAELDRLDAGRPDGISRGEWLRTLALKRKLPQAIPEINRDAWRDLGRSLGNLSTVATAMRGGEYALLENVEATVKELRLALIGVKDES